MAENEYPSFKMMHANFSEYFEPIADSLGQASSSPAQASAAQSKTSKAKTSKAKTKKPETSKPETSKPERSKFAISQIQGPNNTVARVATFNLSNATLDSIGLGEQTVLGEHDESQVTDGYKSGRPDSSNDSPLPEYDGFMSKHDTDTEAGIPSKPREDSERPSMSELMELADQLMQKMSTLPEEPSAKRSTSPPLDHGLAQRASSLSHKKPGASGLRNEIHGSPATDNRKASQCEKTENVPAATSPELLKGGERGALPLQAESKEAPASSSSATPVLGDAMKEILSSPALIARVDKFIDTYKPEYKSQNPLAQSRKRTVLLYLWQSGVSLDFCANLFNHEIVEAFAFAGDEEACEVMRRIKTKRNFLKHAPGFRERDTDKSAIPLPSNLVHAAKADKPAAGVHLRIKLKAHKKGPTKKKTTQKKFEGTNMVHPHSRRDFVADEDSLIPPILFLEGEFLLGIPASLSGPDHPAKLKCRGQDIGLSADEWAKVPNEFRYLPQDTLATFWDFAYNPVVRKMVFDYKRDLALAGKADKLLDLPNKLLAAIVDIQETEIQEGAKHIVDTSEIKTKKPRLSESAITEQSTKLSGTDILAAALLEFDNTLADPSYDTTTAREKFALSKGVKLDSVEVCDFFHQYQELQTLHYSSNMGPIRSDEQTIILEKMASLELEVFGSGNGEESGLAMEDATTSKVKGKQGDILEEDSVIGKGKGKEGDLLVEDSAIGKAKGKGKKSGKGKKKKIKVLIDDAATGKSKEHDMLMEGSTIDEGKDSELLLGDASTGKRKAKESDVLVEDQANGKGKGKENTSPVKDTTSGKGKESGQSDSDGLGTPKPLNLNTAPKNTPSSALPNDLGGPPGLFDYLMSIFQAQFTATKEEFVAARMNLYSFMEHNVRSQKASPDQLDLFCHILSTNVVFDEMSRYIEELQWNRAVVQHSYNPMISEILRRTQHLRPANGLHHPMGVFIAPLPTLMHQYPPGLAPATPAVVTPVVTTPTKEQPKKEQPKKKRTGITKLQQIPIKVKLPFEDSLEVLELREATIVAKIKDGVPLVAAQVVGDLMAIGQSKKYLKEKARLETVGGPLADMLVERQKKMAEESGAPNWWLLP